MTITVRLPSQLRPLAGGAAEVTVAAATVREALGGLNEELASRILDANGQIRRFVNVFVADEDVRFLDGLDTVLVDGQTVSIVPAVAGGAV